MCAHISNVLFEKQLQCVSRHHKLKKAQKAENFFENIVTHGREAKKKKREFISSFWLAVER